MGSRFEGGSRTRETRVKHVVGREVCRSQRLLPVGKVSTGQSALPAGAHLSSRGLSADAPGAQGFLSSPKVGKPHFYLGRRCNTQIIKSQVMRL